MVQSAAMYSLFEDQVDRDSDTKDLIFSILAKSGRHNIAELTRRISQHYRLKLTYQAVRKATRKLHLAGILGIEDGRYYINRPWLVGVKRRVDSLLMDTERRRPKSNRPASVGTQSVYHLESLFDLDNFWADMMLDYLSTLNGEPKPTYFSIAHYAWWMLINLGQETKFWKTIISMGLPAQMLILNRQPLNLWAVKIYKGIGVKCSLKNIRKSDDSILYNIVGDLVVQAQISEDAMKRIRLYYKKCKKIGELDTEYIVKLTHAPCEITFSVYRDAALAQNLMRAYGLKP